MRHQQFRNKPQRQSLIKQVSGIAFCMEGFAVAGFYSAGDLISSVAATAEGCVIKGNVSINSRKKSYHVPGQEDYAVTKPGKWRAVVLHGRRSCAAGWRKAGR